jgi:hypothetical protein
LHYLFTSNNRRQAMQPQLPASILISTQTGQTLSELIDASLSMPPEYGGLLTSHLPMALHSLYKLGATPQRLREFFDVYSSRFIGMTPPPEAKAVTDWHTLKGAETAYPALRSTFTMLVERDGAEQVLRAALPELMLGIAAAAFHGLIRTAHAVQTGHRAELAAALAYWAWRWQPLEVPAEAAPQLAFDAWSERLKSQAQELKFEGNLISIRMENATHSNAYRDLARGPALPADVPAALGRLAADAVKQYVASPNFTVLHMITGLRALRVLMPWMDRCQNVHSILLRAYTAAFLAAQVSASAHQPDPTPVTWRQVIDSAIMSNDDHVIKLVQACVGEADHYGNGFYLQAASLALAQ